MKNFYLFRSAAAVVLMSAAALAQAQLIPQRPVTLVVPYPAGGPLDNAARILAEKVRSSLDTTVVVDNKPGAGGNIGVAGVSKAVPDGHTIVMGAVATHAVNPWLFPKMPYDALMCWLLAPIHPSVLALKPPKISLPMCKKILEN